MSVEHIETVRVRKDGAALTVSLTVSPIRDAQGHIIGASTIARDITLQRRLEAELIEIGEQERKRVGHDLHDGLGQQVGGIELLCRGLARSLAKRRAPEAQTAALLVDQIRAALAQTRALSRGLAPVMDHPDALMLALENLASTTRSIYKIRCSFQCEEPILLADYGAAMHLFRIAQEAVTNAIRHGRTRFINIGLSRQKSRLILEIRDHGRGFPTHGQSGTGMGLHIMSYRAAALGGTFKISESAPKGVKVRCVAPL